MLDQSVKLHYAVTFQTFQILLHVKCDDKHRHLPTLGSSYKALVILKKINRILSNLDLLFGTLPIK